MAKKAKKGDACSIGKGCPCSGLMAILIVVLVWVSAMSWSKIVITIAAALILLGSTGHCGSKSKKK